MMTEKTRHGRRRMPLARRILKVLALFLTMIIGYAALFASLWWAWGNEIDYNNQRAIEYNERRIVYDQME